jgi:hypothetical protein
VFPASSSPADTPGNSNLTSLMRVPRVFNLTHIFDNIYTVRASHSLEFQLAPCAASAACADDVEAHVVAAAGEHCSVVGHDLSYRAVDVYQLHMDQDVGFTLEFGAEPTANCTSPSATIQVFV